MKTVARLLQSKGSDVWIITPDAGVTDALRLMAEKDIGALVVQENERVVGIVTERDIVRKVTMNGHNGSGMHVRDIMTERVLYVRSDTTIEECMALMTEKHLRHLPVFEQDRILGMLSIRDVVADVVAEKSFLIEQLENYIYDIPPHHKSGVSNA
ncbi:MAG: CBS domain-containing protein [Oscillochloris sp.]|nr:CBS domain-containing protein [Oscillochloris sp.]